jgi:transcriptional regulator with XRE-family HTH domain
MSHNTKETLYTSCLITDLKLWKEEVGASYDDIAELLNCSKAYLWDFCRGNHRISYETGKNIENIVTLWSREIFAKWKKDYKERKRNVAQS